MPSTREAKKLKIRLQVCWYGRRQNRLSNGHRLNAEIATLHHRAGINSFNPSPLSCCKLIWQHSSLGVGATSGNNGINTSETLAAKFEVLACSFESVGSREGLSMVSFARTRFTNITARQEFKAA